LSRRVLAAVVVGVVALAAGITLLVLRPWVGEPREEPSLRDPNSNAAVDPDAPSAIAGEVTLRLEHVSNAGNLFRIDERLPPDPDQVAIAAFSTQVAAWLDAHLTDLQTGGDGDLAAIAAPGLMEALSDEATISATTGLASPRRPAESALYILTTAHEGVPRWLTAQVRVTWLDGGEADATFVFVPGDTGPLLIGVESDAPPPPSRPSASESGGPSDGESS
jgi:hypothetical protein